MISIMLVFFGLYLLLDGHPYIGLFIMMVGCGACK